MNKKSAGLMAGFLIIGIGLGIVGVKYVAEWREPEATYVDTSEPKLNQIRGDLANLKSELKTQGKYNCCIKNDCNWCALYMGHCSCEELVIKEGKEKSCPECAAAWNKKQGKVPGIDADAIEVTTFGIYGIEKGGHHHPDAKGKDEDEGDHHQGEGNQKESKDKQKEHKEQGHSDHQH